MSSTSKEESDKHFFCIPFKFKSPFKPKKVQPQETIPLEKRAGDDQTTTDAVNALKDELAEATELRTKLEGELKEANESLDTRTKEAAHKDAEIKRLGEEGDMMRAKLTELRAADTRAKELSTRLADTEKLLNERTTELSAAQVFLTKVDDVSEAEVVVKIVNLNARIITVSGNLSEIWEEREHIPGTLIDEDDLEQTRKDFGNLIAEQIAARNQVAVNLAVQMHLGHFIERITSGWGGGPAGGNIQKIYGMISTKESQTIASRWRTLTKRYTPSEGLPQSKEIIGGLARILMVTQTFSDLEEAVGSVEERAGSEIDMIIKETVQLDDIIKTKMASSDMAVYVVPPVEIFSEDTMWDEFEPNGSKGSPVPLAVAGTAEIGLLQKSDNVEKVLLKPKVILELDLVAPEAE